MSRILALADSPGSLDSLIGTLREDGHNVVEVVPGTSTRIEADLSEYDLVVVKLDEAGLPDLVKRSLRLIGRPIVAIGLGMEGESASAGLPTHAVVLQAGPPDVLVPRLRELLGYPPVRDPGRPVYDRAVALKRLIGNETLLADMAGLFFEDAPMMLGELRAAVETVDLAAARRAAHSLAGNSATFEGLDAVEAARVVELAAARGDLEAVRDGIPRLEGEITRLERALREEFDATARATGR